MVVVYAEWDGARIRRVSLASGDTLTLARLFPDQTRRLATDGISVYWIDQSSVGKVSLSGGPPATIAGRIAADASRAEGIAVDLTRVYWTEADAGAVMAAKPK